MHIFHKVGYAFCILVPLQEVCMMYKTHAFHYIHDIFPIHYYHAVIFIIILIDVFHYLSPDAAHLADLYHKANQFLTQGLAPSTITTYSAGKKKYIQFCITAQVNPMPSSETTLTLFASYLATANISLTPPSKYICQLFAICMSLQAYMRYSASNLHLDFS